MQVIVVSPLVRTLETATGAFGSGPSRTPNDMFMRQLPGQNQWSTEHDAVALPVGVPVISHEGCRERVSKCFALALLNLIRILFHCNIVQCMFVQWSYFSCSETAPDVPSLARHVVDGNAAAKMLIVNTHLAPAR